MQIEEAVAIIDRASINSERPTIWADLGCGNGVFTYALANLLNEHSTIYAVDKFSRSFSGYENGKTKIEFLKADFEKNKLPFSELDGILMANSLHYVVDKKSLIKQLEKYFFDNGMFIIVEYNTMKANTWVPYPIDFLNLEKLFAEIGYTHIEKLAERPSVFGRGGLYGCLIKKEC